MSSGFGLSPAATKERMRRRGRGRLMSAKMQHVMRELVDEGEVVVVEEEE